MKIRSGFVSNSSSSSFVVAWPKKPKTTEEARGMLFADDASYPNPYPWEGSPNSFCPSMISEWVLKNLEWGKNHVRDSLVGDINSHVSYLVYEAGEGRRNTFTYDENDRMVSTLELAGREMHELLALLSKEYPQINWKGRIEEAIERHRKYRKIEDKLKKEMWALEAELRKEYDCEQLPWQDTSKMTEEEKAAYEQARKDNYAKYDATVTKDPRYKKAQTKRNGLYRKSRDTKRIEETYSLIANRFADLFYAENEGCVFSVVEIHDDSSLGSAMEHGDLFSRLPHKKFSHH